MSYDMDQIPGDMLEALKARLEELREQHAMPAVTDEVVRWIAYLESSINEFDEDGIYVGESEEDEEEPEEESFPGSAWSPMLDDGDSDMLEPGDLPEALVGGDDGFSGFAPPEGK